MTSLSAYDLQSEPGLLPSFIIETNSVSESSPVQIIDVLVWLYTFNDYLRVSDYLRENGELPSLLVECYLQATKYFGPLARIKLELLFDPDGHDKKLFAIIPTNLPVPEASSRLKRLDEDWWLDASGRVNTKVNIDVEYV